MFGNPQYLSQISIPESADSEVMQVDTIEKERELIRRRQIWILALKSLLGVNILW